MIPFSVRSKDVKKQQIQDFITANIEEDTIIEYEQIYINNLQYFLINELLKNNKHVLALKVMEDINKEVLAFTGPIRKKQKLKNMHIEIDDNFYLHLALVYEKTNTILAVDAVKKIEESQLKEFCLFLLENKYFSFFDKELFVDEKASINKKLISKQYTLLKEEVFGKIYNKYLIDYFIKQFKCIKDLIEFLEENLNEKWLEELTLQHKIDFYSKTKHINLCYYFLQTGFIKKPEPQSFEYRNEDYKRKIELFLNEKSKEKKKMNLVFPGNFCTKSSGHKIDISSNEDIRLITETVKEKRKKYVRKVLKTKQIKLEYKIKEE